MSCLSDSYSLDAFPFAVMGLLISLTACNAETRQKPLPIKIACPSQLSASSAPESGTVRYGMLTPSEKILMEIGLVNGLPEDSINPIFSDEHIDDWDVTAEGAVAIWEYSAGDHPDMWLRCDYFPRKKYDGRAGGYQKADGRVTLLLRIPDSANFKCKFVRSPENMRYSAACDLSYPTGSKSR